jgi:hypothetical protein
MDPSSQSRSGGYRAMLGLVCAASLGLACNKGGDSQAPATSATPAAPAPAPAPPPLAAASSAPAAATAPAPRTYAVFGVKAGDVLNVRAEPTAASKKVYSFTPEVKGIVATGQVVENDKTPWMEVKFEGGSGWLNRLFVTEQHAGNGCDDPNLTAAIRAFMRAVTSDDATALQALVSPLRGLSIRQANWNPSVSIAQADVPSLFTAAAPRQWGKADGSGAPIVEPFKAHLLGQLKRAVGGKGAQEHCGKLLMGGSAGSHEWPPEYANLTHVSFHNPGEGGNDWVTWVMGMEYVDAKPFVATLVQYQWEI